jgi:hypothetical protein
MQLKSKSVLLALIAVFAMSAVAASAASAALPEFKPVPTKKKFTGSSGELAVMMDLTVERIICTASKTSGEITGAATMAKVVVKLTGCQYQNGSIGCPAKTHNANAEEIVTEPLSGQLGSVATTEAASGVGVLLKPENKYAIIAETEASCGHGVGVLEGSVAGEITTVGKKQLTTQFVFTPTKEFGSDKIKQITLASGVAKPALSWQFGTAYIRGTVGATFEEALEVT